MGKCTGASTWKIIAFKELLEPKERTWGVNLDFQTGLDCMLTEMWVMSSKSK